MGIWEKWLVKKICKQALKENKNNLDAAKASFKRIHKDLLPLRADEERMSRVHNYLFDIWEELTGETFPKIQETARKVFEEKADKIYK